MPIASEEYGFDPRPQFPFFITMKRYPNLDDDRNGFTLIFTHGTGFLKELWEPIIERIFETENAKPDGLRIREAWAIDAPNHGDAATLNAALLQSGAYDLMFAWDNYARATHSILSGLGTFTNSRNQPVEIDFTTRRLIGIGHSMGGVALILAHTFYPYVKFDSLVLVEPMLITARHFKRMGLKLALGDGALARRDFWESKEEAWTSLSTKGMKKWDERVVKLFVEFGLRETTKGDGFDRTGVTLKCPKAQESATFNDRTSGMLAFDFLDTLCSKLPVHVIWGAIDDYLPAHIKEDIHGSDFRGRTASVQRVPKGGHLAPQMRPDEVADTILNTFSSLAASATRSRL